MQRSHVHPPLRDRQQRVGDRNPLFGVAPHIRLIFGVLQGGFHIEYGQPQRRDLGVARGYIGGARRRLRDVIRACHAQRREQRLFGVPHRELGVRDGGDELRLHHRPVRAWLLPAAAIRARKMQVALLSRLQREPRLLKPQRAGLVVNLALFRYRRLKRRRVRLCRRERCLSLAHRHQSRLVIQPRQRLPRRYAVVCRHQNLAHNPRLGHAQPYALRGHNHCVRPHQRRGECRNRHAPAVIPVIAQNEKQRHPNPNSGDHNHNHNPRNYSIQAYLLSAYAGQRRLTK